jgi:hypothetical protein
VLSYVKLASYFDWGYGSGLPGGIVRLSGSSTYCATPWGATHRPRVRSSESLGWGSFGTVATVSLWCINYCVSGGRRLERLEGLMEANEERQNGPYSIRLRLRDKLTDGARPIEAGADAPFHAPAPLRRSELYDIPAMEVPESRTRIFGHGVLFTSTSLGGRVMS